MKKRILSAALTVGLLFSLTGCNYSKVETEEKVKKDTSSMFVYVEQTTSWRVVYHKQTKVMYVVSDGSYNHGTFTLLVDADGNPMLWEK